MKDNIVYIIFLTAIVSYAQAPDTLWTKTYGGVANDVGNSIKQTSDGGYIIAGYTESFGAGQQDVWLLKTDASGDTVWTKTYGNANNDVANHVQPTADGGYIIVGMTQDDDIWLIKTDHLGDSVWTKRYGAINLAEIGYCVQQTTDGGYIITGRRYRSFIAPGCVLLLKTDENGDTVWCRDYYFGQSSGGFCVHETFDGGYVVAGAAYFLGPPCRGILLKTDANGDSVWCNLYGRHNPDFVLLSVEETADSGYIACGTRRPWDLSSALWIVRTNAQGVCIMTREYGDSINEKHGNSVQVTNDNGYIFSGGTGDSWTSGDLFLFKTAENGDSLWCAIYGRTGDDTGNEVVQTNDGGYIVVGCTESLGAGGSDVWIIKTEPDVGVEEDQNISIKHTDYNTTIISGPLQLPEGKKCKVFDITGRVVEPDKIQPGIYFIEVDGILTKKVVKVR